MPVHVPVDGSPPFASYPAILGPERKGGKVRRKDPINPTVDEFDDAETLLGWFETLEKMTIRLYGNDRVGEKGVQKLINWMSVVGDRLEFPPIACDARGWRGRWNKKLIERTVSNGDGDEVELAQLACRTTEEWYGNDHGYPDEHQQVVNAITLAFRL